MRPIRGPRHAADDERTVEAPPEEPTLSAGLDVRAAFEAQDKTVPGALVGLAPLEEGEPRQDRTIPLVSPAVVLEIQAQAQAQAQARVAEASAHIALPPPSDPVLVTASREDDPFASGAEPPVAIPGVGGAQRRRMLRIVIGVLSVCGLLCVGALARQLFGAKETATPMPTATATATATATVSASSSATTAPSALASAEPSAQTPTPSATALVASAVPEPPAAPAPPPARAHVPDAPPAVHRPAAAAALPHRADRRPPAKGRPPIVRDAPF